MNLYRLDRLIDACIKSGDFDLVEFYQKKRLELLEQISNEINLKLKYQ